MASCCLRVSAFAASSGSRQGVELFFAAEEEADPVELAVDGEEATVVFEGAGVFDAVLVELPQEASRKQLRIIKLVLCSFILESLLQLYLKNDGVVGC